MRSRPVGRATEGVWCGSATVLPEPVSLAEGERSLEGCVAVRMLVTILHALIMLTSKETYRTRSLCQFGTGVPVSPCDLPSVLWLTPGGRLKGGVDGRHAATFNFSPAHNIPWSVCEPTSVPDTMTYMNGDSAPLLLLEGAGL